MNTRRSSDMAGAGGSKIAGRYAAVFTYISVLGVFFCERFRVGWAGCVVLQRGWVE